MSEQLQTKIATFIRKQILNTGQRKHSISAADDQQKLLPHGLIGQSWSNKQYNNQWEWLEGNVDDYLLRDGLQGKDFRYTRYNNNSSINCINFINHNSTKI